MFAWLLGVHALLFIGLSSPLPLTAPSPAIGLAPNEFQSANEGPTTGITIGFTAEEISQVETNGTVTIEVIRSGGLEQEVRAWASASPAEPFHSSRLYTPITNELVFGPGETRAEFTITAWRDYAPNGDETALLRLEPMTDGVRASTASAQLHWLDRDMNFHLVGPFLTQEQAGTARLQVFRDGSDSLAAEIEVRAEDGSARAGIDYGVPAGRLTFPPGSRVAELDIEIYNDDRAQGARSFTLRFENPTLGVLGVDRVKFEILDDEVAEGPGAVASEYSGSTFNSMVSSLRQLPDGRLLVTGAFGTYRGEPAPNVLILHPDGSRDVRFNCPGIAPPGLPSLPVLTAVPLADGRFLAVGFFQSFGGLPRTNGVILASDGSVVTEVTADFNSSSIQLWPLSDGRVLVAGDIVSRFNGQPVPKVFRLTADGQLDPTFIGGTNCLQAPHRVLSLADGQVYANGVWRIGDGATVRLVRLLENGLPDPAFDERLPQFPIHFTALVQLLDGSLLAWPGRLLGGGAIDPVFGDRVFRTIYAVLPDGRLIATEAREGKTHLVRLLADGTPDGEFDAQFDRSLQDIAVGTDGSVTVIGSFSSVNDEPRNRIVRLLGDDPTAPSRIRWHGRQFGALRSAGRARVSLLQTGDTNQTRAVQVRTRNGEALAGVDFVPLDAEVVFQPGERVKFVEIPLLPRTSFHDPQFTVEVSGPGTDAATRLAYVTILDPSGTVEFESAGHSIQEGSRPTEVGIIRAGGLAYPEQVTLAATGSATQLATNFSNYAVADLGAVIPSSVSFAAGESRRTIVLYPQDDPYVEGPEVLALTLGKAAQGLVGSLSTHVMTLVDNDDSWGPGENLWPGVELFARHPQGYWSTEPRWTTTGWSRGPVARRNDGSREISVPLPSGRSDRLLDVSEDGRLLIATLGPDPRRQVRVRRGTAENQADPSSSEQTLVYSGANGAGQTLQIAGCTLPDGGALLGVGVFEGTITPLDLTRLDAAGQILDGFGDSRLGLSSSANPNARWQIAPQSDGRILVGGTVTVLEALPGEVFIRRHLVRLLPDGFPDRTYLVIFGPTESASVQAFQVRDDGSVVVVGRFDAVNAVPRPGVAVLWPDGEVDRSSQPDPGDWVAGDGFSAVGLGPDGGFLVAGLGKDGRHRVVRLNRDGQRVASFVPPTFNDRVASIFSFPDGRFVVTGAFDQAQGEWRSGVAWFDSFGHLQAARPLWIRERRRGPDSSVRIETRTRVEATLLVSSDLWHWSSLRALTLEPGVNDVPVPETSLDMEFLRVDW